MIAGKDDKALEWGGETLYIGRHLVLLGVWEARDDGGLTGRE